jgi:N6-L-threonylcarbamoyladenine synthase
VNILGIETSCDETAAAVVTDGRDVRSNVISSQIAIHQAYGGVVPELAARGQVQAIIPVIRQGIAEAGIEPSAIDAIAFTQGPGLAGSLLVGVNAAKALALSLGVPLLPINHLAGHVYANWLQLPGDEVPPPELPAICLLVSGGHTELLLIEEVGMVAVLGRTIDDAAGEAFDKGARLLGLGYPGGPAIQRAAEGGDPAAFALPRSALGDSLDFSFSGLKTALLREVEPYRVISPDDPDRDPQALFPEHRPPHFRDDLPVADLAASFEEAIVDALATKTIRAAHHHQARSILIAGGVAANRRLRDRLGQRVTTEWPGGEPPHVQWPHLSLCTDNAAMIAGLGYVAWNRGERGGLDADAYPRWPIDQPQPVTGELTRR